MSPRTALRRASGVAATIALAVAALVWAPSAAFAASSQGCAAYNGKTVAATGVSTSSMTFTAGEVIQANVPVKVGMTYSSGFTFTWARIVSNSFTVPTTGTYKMDWYTEPSTLVTWKFTCGTSSIAAPSPSPTATTTTDTDRDGVVDTKDRCASTKLPDTFSKLMKGRYSANAAGKFVDGAGIASPYTIASTKGCSAAQIISARKLGTADQRSGITLSTLQSWITSVA